MTLLFDVWLPCRRSGRKVICCGGTPTSSPGTSYEGLGISLLLFCSICSPYSAAHGRQSGARIWRHPARGRQSGGQGENLAKLN